MPTEWSAQRHVWRDHAACIGKPMMWFYASERWPELIELALATCQGCPIRQQCLTDALNYEVGDRDVYGVRGGMVASERVRLIRGRAAEPAPATISGQFIRLHKVFAAAI